MGVVWHPARVRRRWSVALLVAALAGGIVSLAAAQSDKAPTAIAAQTTTTPEQIGQDFGGGGQTQDNSATAPGSQALPFTGWRGRDAVVLGLLLLGTGLVLRSATARAHASRSR